MIVHNNGGLMMDANLNGQKGGKLAKMVENWQKWWENGQKGGKMAEIAKKWPKCWKNGRIVKIWQKWSKNGQQLPKGTKSCNNLLKVAKSRHNVLKN